MQQNTLGTIAYEITNYLGNVNVVISDRKLWVLTSSAFKAVVLSRTDYFPFGMEISSRTTVGTYRFGYNGMEQDPEAKGEGNSYTTEFRQYDPRIGRWLSLDPLMAQYPMMSPYVAFNNNPIYFVDPLGLEGVDPKKGEPEMKIIDYDEVKVYAKGLPKNDNFFKKIDNIFRETGNFFRKIESGIVDAVKQVGAFGAGVANAVGSNSLLGAGRKDPSGFGKYSKSAEMGQRLGDYISVIQGAGEVVIGTGGNLFGVALDATGVGAVVGIPVNVASTTLSMHGVTVFSTATSNIITDKMESSTSDKMNDSGGSSKGSEKTNTTSKQTQTNSKSVWYGKGKERIDVENPNPKKRLGQVHYQDNKGNKYIYDPYTKSFKDAPKKVNDLLKNKDFKKGIEKGLKYLED